MTQIHALPADVVQLMAAGEVIDSPAAALRELIENALDAQATRLTIQLDLAQGNLRVADNGVGMTPADLQQAARPHCTSKIRDRADLHQVTSLGFRGEALHSLAQLATLTIWSRVAAATATGWSVTYDRQGQPQQLTTIALAPGTVVSVTDLFGSWPARRAALPPLPRQLRDIQHLIGHFALCYPHLTWHVEQGDRLWFAIAPGPDPTYIWPQLLRTIQPTDLRTTTLTLPHQAQLSLTLGLPDRCQRRRPDALLVAINGRPVQSPDLVQILLAGLRRTLPRDRYPLCFLHLHLPPDQVDWHRHPAKTELYIQQLAQWQPHIHQAIAHVLELQPDSPLDAYASRQMAQVVKAAEASPSYRDAPVPDPRLLPLRAIGQVHQMYILAEHPNGLWLIEQHIAHERVLYEQLRDRWQVTAMVPPLMLPQLSPAQVAQLQRIGLEVEPFGEQVWIVRTVPAVLRDRADCAAALVELSQGGDLDTALVAIACRTALRNGTPLDLPAMQALLDQWQRTQNPRTCPHGRPIYLSLEESSLARFFRRHWVIGKSHGI